MGLEIYQVSSFDTEGEEIVFKKIVSLYENVQHSAYLIYDVPINFDQKHDVGKPDFVLIDEKYGICVIEVKDWGKHVLERFGTIGVFRHNGETYENPVAKADKYFNILNNLLRKNNSKWNRKYVKSNLILTKFNKNDELQKIVDKSGMSWTFFRDEIKDLTIDKIFHELPCEIGPELAQFSLAIIKPEIYVGKLVEFCGDQVLKRKEEIHLLDEKQIEVVNFPDLGHFLVSGVPGSGKTITVLARAFKLLERNPDWNIAITCFNKKLKGKIEKMAEDRMLLLQSHADANNFKITGKIVVRTFHGLCFDVHQKDFNHYIGKSDRERSEQMESEAFEKARPIYDAVLVDEYQDFEQSWLLFIKNICKKHERKNLEPIESIYFSGDKLQQINREDDTENWKQLGFQVSGRSRFLNVSYRSCSNHLKMAIKFLGSDAWNSYKSLELEKMISNSECLSHRPNGRLRLIEGDAFEVTKLIDELVQNDIKPEDILVIGMKFRIDALKNELEHYVKMGVDFESTMQIKGCEAPVVILLNTDYFEPPFLTVKNQRRTMYMCLTRSNYALYILARDFTKGFASELEEIYTKIDLGDVA